MNMESAYYVKFAETVGRTLMGPKVAINLQADDWHRQLSNIITDMSFRIHEMNVLAGWWNDIHTGEDLHGKRNEGEMCALLHSEISEALEAHRKNLMDDKLPHRKGLEVELADGLIRAMDTSGARKFTLGEGFLRAAHVPSFSTGVNVGEALAVIHAQIARASSVCVFDSYRYRDGLGATVRAILNLGYALNLDLAGAFVEKLAYNAQRADHKPENRRAANGKRF